MTEVSRCATWLCLSIALGAAVCWSVKSERVVRASAGVDPFLDTDGDLLPDSLEWVAFSDPTKPDTDTDTRDDFLEVVQHTAPFAPTLARPFDNEMRLLLSSGSGGAVVDGDSGIWLHCLFRFATGAPTVDWFLPSIHTNGAAVPIGQLFGRTPFRLASRPAAGGGSYAVLTLLLASAREFEALLPCTVSARASVGGRLFATGSYVLNVGGFTTALMPTGLDASRSFLLQSLTSGSSSNSFFSRNKICEMELAVIGSTGGGHICEVERAGCEPANGLRCNVSCDQAAGAMIFVPDGLGTISGG
jgi:hypothetical protein